MAHLFGLFVEGNRVALDAPRDVTTPPVSMGSRDLKNLGSVRMV
jgi:hypothetical protein